MSLEQPQSSLFRFDQQEIFLWWKADESRSRLLASKYLTLSKHFASARLRNVVLGSAANLAAPLSTIITGPLLARSLGPDGRGITAVLLAPLALANLVFTLGVPESLTYFAAKDRLTGQQAIRRALIGGFICAGAAIAVLFFFAPYLFRGQTQYIRYFNALLLSLPVTLCFSAIRGIVQGRQSFSAINAERVFGAALRCAVLVGFVAMHALTPLSAVWISIVTGAAASVFLLPALRMPSCASSGPPATKSIVRYAAATALGNFGGLMIMRLDQVLMVSLTSHAQLAFYAVAVSLAELPLAVVSACRDIAFSVAAERDDHQIIARYCRLTLLAVGLICLAGVLMTPVALPMLFGRDFSPAIDMAEVLFVATLGRAVTAVIGAGLMALGRLWLRSVLQLSGATLTAVLIFIVVPHEGGIGAAWITAFTYLFLAAASLIVYTRYTGLSFSECLVPARSDLQRLTNAYASAFPSPRA